MVQFHGAYRKLFVEIWRYQWYFTFTESPPKHTNAMRSIYNSVFSCVFLHTSQSSVFVPVWSTLVFLLRSASWFPPHVYFLSPLANLYLTLMFPPFCFWVLWMLVLSLCSSLSFLDWRHLQSSLQVSSYWAFVTTQHLFSFKGIFPSTQVSYLICRFWVLLFHFQHDLGCFFLSSMD